MLVRQQGGSLFRDTHLPWLRDEAIIGRMSFQLMENELKEDPIAKSPAYAMAQEWLNANPDGVLRNSPRMVELEGEPVGPIGEGAQELMSTEEMRQQVGGLLNDLNAMYRQQVDERGSILQSPTLGPIARKLAGLYVPHMFDDAPMPMKLGVTAFEGLANFGESAGEMFTSTVQGAWGLGMSLLRDRFEPGSTMDQFLKKFDNEGNRITLSEMATAFNALIMGETLDVAAEQALTNKERLAWTRNRENNQSNHLLNGVASTLGTIYGFAFGGPGTVATKVGGVSGGAFNTITQGVARLMGGGAKAQRLGRLMAGFAGGTVGFGAAESLLAGGQNEQTYAGAFLHGMAFSPIYMAAGALGKGAERALLRRAAPMKVAQAVSGLIEGAGFGQFTDLAEGANSLTWRLLKDPTRENLSLYMEHIGVNMAAMGMFKLMHQTTPYESLVGETMRTTGMTPEELLTRAEREAVQERQRLAIREARVVRAEAPFEQLFLEAKPERREQLKAEAQELRRQAERERAIEPIMGKAAEQVPQMAKTGSPKSFLGRLVRFTQKQLAGEKKTQREMAVLVTLGPEGELQAKAIKGEHKMVPGDRIQAAAKAHGEGIHSLTHSHPSGFTFSGYRGDMALFVEQFAKQSSERVPFLMSTQDRVDVLTMHPGVKPAKSRIKKAYQAGMAAAINKALKEFPDVQPSKAYAIVDGKVRHPEFRQAYLRNQVAELQTRLEPLGVELRSYSLKEADRLWKDFIETREWKLEAPELAPGPAWEPTTSQREAAEAALDFATLRVAERLGMRPTEDPAAILREMQAQLVKDPELQKAWVEELSKKWLPRAEEITGQTYPRTFAGVQAAFRALQMAPKVPREAPPGLYHEQFGRPRTLAEEGLAAPSRASQRKIDILFGREGPRAREAQETRQGLRAVFGRFARWIKDPKGAYASAQEAMSVLAERLDRLGYRSRFEALGRYERMLTAENTRLNLEIKQAPQRAWEEMRPVLEPLVAVGGETPAGKEPTRTQAEQRQTALQNALEWLFLRDFSREATEGRPLPAGLTSEEVRQRLEAIQLTGEERAVADGIRRLLDHKGNQLVQAGMLRPEDLKADYMPHKVVDWTETMDSFRPGARLGRLRRAFAGYTRARLGSERLIDTSIESVQAYLTQAQKDLAINDYIRRTGGEIHGDMLEALGLPRDADLSARAMPARVWEALRKTLDQNDLVVYDTKMGALGRHTLQLNPQAAELYRFIQAQTGWVAPDPVEIGKRHRPVPDAGSFIVPKEVATHWLDVRRPQLGVLDSPLVQKGRALIGKWFKGPALRGLVGLGVPGRRGRDIISDVLSLYTKKSVRDASKILKIAKPGEAGSRIARALASKEWRQNLTPSEEGLLHEMELLGVVQTGRIAVEVIGAEGQKRYVDDPLYQQIWPDYRRWRREVSKWARSDFGWVQAVDAYGENVFRAALWIHERSKLIAQGFDAKNAARGAAVEVGRVLVNYDHLTPLEHVLNTAAFPFYSWARHQLTSVGAEFLRKPGQTAAKASLIAGLPVLWNQIFAPDEESALIQVGARVVQYPHLILPWIRDENGNSAVLSFEGPADLFFRFFGVGGAPSKIGDYLWGHGDPAILMRDLGQFPQEWILGQFGQDWMAPWIREVAGRSGWTSKFTTIEEQAQTQARVVGEINRPYGDAARLLDARRSIAQRVAGMLPILSFQDLAVGEPQRKRRTEFYAGRQQRQVAQLNSEISKWMPALKTAWENRDRDRIRRIVDNVWNEWADTLSPQGYTKRHIAQRMVRSLERRVLRDMRRMTPDQLSSRFYSLSFEQKVALLRHMGVIE